MEQELYELWQKQYTINSKFELWLHPSILELETDFYWELKFKNDSGDFILCRKFKSNEVKSVYFSDVTKTGFIEFHS